MKLPWRRKPKAKTLRKLKKLVTWTILSYAICFWVLPILLTMLFTQLPYLHSHSLKARFVVSLLSGSLIVSASLAAYRSSRTQLKQKPLLLVLGLLMFSFAAAALGGNTAAVLVKVLPGREYKQTLYVVHAETRGVRFRSRDLTLMNTSDGSMRYLAVSRRLLGDLPVKSGDTVLVSGKENLFGVYVKTVLKAPGLSANNSFKPKPLRGSA